MILRFQFLTYFLTSSGGPESFSPDSTKLLITGKVNAGPAKYAYGFEDARDAHGNGWVGHGGGAPGMNGDLKIYPKSGYVVAVLAILLSLKTQMAASKSFCAATMPTSITFGRLLPTMGGRRRGHRWEVSGTTTLSSRAIWTAASRFSSLVTIQTCITFGRQRRTTVGQRRGPRWAASGSTNPSSR